MTAPRETTDLLADPAEVLHHLAEQPFFEDFSDRALGELARRFTLRPCVPGELVCEAGTLDTHLYVLVEGTLLLARPSGRSLGELNTGAIIGDRGLLLQKDRSTTVLAQGHCLLLSLDYRAFREMLVHSPRRAAQLTQALTRSLSKRSTPPAEPQSPGLLEGRYRCLRQLGQGGMATVWLARDERLGVDRAVKLLAPRLQRLPAARERFEIEARTMASLHHPNLVPVHHVHVDARQAFMVMELARGGSLAQSIQRSGPLSPRRAAQVMVGVLRALEIAHRQRLVHRDVKPHNILFQRDGTPLLTDFGIARLMDWETDRARSLPMHGSGGYMAPEQRMDARRAGPQADLYGVGATLFTSLTGTPPPELFAREVQRRLSEVLPPPLGRVLHRATCYLPYERYRDAASMRGALEQALPELADAPLAWTDQPLPESITQDTQGGEDWTPEQGGSSS